MSEADPARLREILLKLLVKDGEGNIIVTPVSNWIVTDIDQTSVLLALWLVKSEDDLRAGIGSRVVQLALHPQQAATLAEELKMAVTPILNQRPSGPTN